MIEVDSTGRTWSRHLPSSIAEMGTGGGDYDGEVDINRHNHAPKLNPKSAKQQRRDDS